MESLLLPGMHAEALIIPLHVLCPGAWNQVVTECPWDQQVMLG